MSSLDQRLGRLAREVVLAGTVGFASLTAAGCGDEFDVCDTDCAKDGGAANADGSTATGETVAAVASAVASASSSSSSASAGPGGSGGAGGGTGGSGGSGSGGLNMPDAGETGGAGGAGGEEPDAGGSGGAGGGGMPVNCGYLVVAPMGATKFEGVVLNETNNPPQTPFKAGDPINEANDAIITNAVMSDQVAVIQATGDGIFDLRVDYPNPAICEATCYTGKEPNPNAMYVLNQDVDVDAGFIDSFEGWGSNNPPGPLKILSNPSGKANLVNVNNNPGASGTAITVCSFAKLK